MGGQRVKEGGEEERARKRNLGKGEKRRQQKNHKGGRGTVHEMYMWYYAVWCAELVYQNSIVTLQLYFRLVKTQLPSCSQKPHYLLNPEAFMTSTLQCFV